jgi:hypothetical protein
MVTAFFLHHRLVYADNFCPYDLWESEANSAFNAGRIGAKASRVIRMIPLVRLVKLGKVTFQRSKGKVRLLIFYRR